jgi:uncharacterized protein YidB (DUF937 family)
VNALIQLILSLFGGGAKSQVMDVIMNILLKKGQSGGAASTDPAAGSSGGGAVLGELMERFKEKGLGEVFGSWVGTGKNQAIRPDQVRDAIGDDQMGQMAQQAGLSVDELSKYLSKYLPGAVDRMTPDGKLPN